MSDYAVSLASRAARQYEKLPPGLKHRIAAKIDGLAADPRPPGSRSLAGRGPEMRVRIGDYPVIYVVDDARAMVTVVEIGHRRDIDR